MEETKCEICGGDNVTLILDKLTGVKIFSPEKYLLYVEDKPVNYRNVCCNNCGLVYLNPRMTQEETKKFYESQYRNKYTTGDEEGYINNHFSFTNSHFGIEIYNAVSRYDFLKRMDLIKQGLCTLDIGSSLGAMAAYFKAAGCKSYGVELSPFGHYSQELFDLKGITHTSFEEYNPRSKFDLICICDGLEHFSHPKRVLLKIREILTEKGIVLIEVPDIFKPHKSLIGFFSNAHLYTFSANSLKNLLNICGLEIIHFDYSAPQMNIRIVAQKGKYQEIGQKDRADSLLTLLTRYEQVYSSYCSYFNEKISFSEAKEKRDNLFPKLKSLEFIEAHRISRQNLEQAILLLQDYLENNFNEENLPFSKGNTYIELGHFYLLKGDKAKASYYLEMALSLIPRIDRFPYLENLRRKNLFNLDKFYQDFSLEHKTLFKDIEELKTEDRRQNQYRPKSEGGNYEANYQSALSYLKVGLQKNALESLLRAYTQVPEGKKRDTNSTYLHILSLLTKLNLQNKTTKEAIRYLEEGLNIYSNHIDLLFLKSLIFLDHRMYGETFLTLIQYLLALEASGQERYSYEFNGENAQKETLENLIPLAYQNFSDRRSFKKVVLRLLKSTQNKHLEKAYQIFCSIEGKEDEK